MSSSLSSSFFSMVQVWLQFEHFKTVSLLPMVSKGNYILVYPRGWLERSYALLTPSFGVVAPLWLRAKCASCGGRGMFDHEVSQAQPVQAREAEEVPRSQLGGITTKGCAAEAI